MAFWVVPFLHNLGFAGSGVIAATGFVCSSISLVPAVNAGSLTMHTRIDSVPELQPRIDGVVDFEEC